MIASDFYHEEHEGLFFVIFAFFVVEIPKFNECK